MKDTPTLLMAVLKGHYRERQEILQNALALIKEYTERLPTNENYDEVLKTLHSVMSDLPLNILVYFLSTVPLPSGKGRTNSNFVDLMRKTNQAISNNIRPILLDYLDKLAPPVPTKSIDDVTEPMECEELHEDCSKGINKTTDTSSTVCKSLLDTCMQLILTNMASFKCHYETESRKVWKLSLGKCDHALKRRYYDYIKDINVKMKWLRMIDDGYVTMDALKEVYGASEEILEKCLRSKSSTDHLFVIDDELWKAIVTLISS